MSTVIFFIIIFAMSSCNRYVAKNGYEIKNQIDFLDFSNKIVDTYVVADYRYLEYHSGVKVYVGDEPSANINSWDFVVWNGPYRLTRVEVIKKTLNARSIK